MHEVYAWALSAFLVIIVLSIATVTYYRHQDEIILELVKAGADPIAARCSLVDNMGDNPTCLIYIQSVK